jgi:dipeptidyl aminopeptidase/acylaminoacyl peptidase
MKSLIWALAALLIGAVPCAAAPLEVYGRLPYTEDVQISPDGTKLALMNTKGDARTIYVFNIDKMTLLRSIAAGSLKVRSMEWADEQTLVFTLSEISKESEYLDEIAFGYIYDIKADVTKPIVFNAPELLNRIYSAPQIRRVNGKTLVFVRAQAVAGNSYDGEVLALSELSARRSVVVKRGDFKENDWLVDGQGKVLVETAFDRERVKGQMTVFTPNGRRTVRAPDGKVLYGAVGLSGDGRSLIASYGAPDSSDEGVLSEVSLETGEWSGKEMSPQITGLAFDPVTTRLVSYRELVGDTFTYTFTDPAEAAFWAKTEKAFGDSRVTPVSWSANRQRLVVYVDSPTDGPAYALVDRSTGRAEWLPDVYGVEPGEVAEVRPIKYKAADGLEITGYLTLPRGREARNLPLIVLPHGGPASRDVPGFDWWAQALASRGYAVLQPNFRGSDGLGIKFLNAGFGEWGKKMQTDLSDGVRHFAAQGVIDPKRVCIVGASYGGYAALAGATIDLGVYRCAASIAGVSDLERMLQVERQTGGRQAEKYWKSFMGVAVWTDPKLDLISPIKHVAQVEAPVLLIHGKDDSVVLYDQSVRMADALRKAGKSVELVTLDGEDHWLSSSKTRLLMLTSLVAFLEKHNPPDAPLKAASSQ